MAHVFYAYNLNLSMHKFSKVKLCDQFVVNMGSVLGKGATGCVYEGIDLRNNNKVAVKVIELSTITNEVTEYLLKMEKAALMQLNSPNVLRGLRILQDNKYCFMVTEFCNGGTLKKHIIENQKLQEEKALRIVKSILQGYQNLVDRKVVHRDLKPANIMLHDEMPKIIDFGYCEIAGYAKPKLQYNVGSPSYMAPESYTDNIYNEKTQIWSIGVILFECLTGKTVDDGLRMEDIYKLIYRQGVPYPDNVNVSQRCRNIINWCLKINPSKRPTCSELLDECFNSIERKEPSVKKIESQAGLSTHKTLDTERQIKNHMACSEIFSHKLENLEKSEIMERNPRMERASYGPLTNPHQQAMNKYVNNRVKPAFSAYDQGMNKQKCNLMQGSFDKRATIAHQPHMRPNQYGMQKENIVNHNWVQMKSPRDSFNLNMGVNQSHWAGQNHLPIPNLNFGQFAKDKTFIPHQAFHGIQPQYHFQQPQSSRPLGTPQERDRAYSYRV